MKTCLQCNIEKSIEEFASNKRKKDGKDIYCKSCNKTRVKKYNKAVTNRESKPLTEAQKDYQFRWRHGFERSEALALVKEQGTCKICNVPISQEFRDWVMDHDHNCCPRDKTCDKCRRGFICQACNKVLGFAKDNVETLQAAINYLQEYNRSKIDELHIRSDGG